MKYIEIFIESFGTYILLVLMIRFLGKKEMSKLSVSDLIVFLIISELMTISIGNENVNFLQAALAVYDARNHNAGSVLRHRAYRASCHCQHRMQQKNDKRGRQ